MAYMLGLFAVSVGLAFLTGIFPFYILTISVAFIALLCAIDKKVEPVVLEPSAGRLFVCLTISSVLFSLIWLGYVEMVQTSPH